MGVAAAPWVDYRTSHLGSRTQFHEGGAVRDVPSALPDHFAGAPKGAPRAVGDRGPRPREPSPRNYFRAATKTPPKRTSAPTS